MASIIVRKNIWKLMLDIRPSKNRAHSDTLLGRKVYVDFVSDSGYKERDVRIGTIRPFMTTYRDIRARLLREHDDFEHTVSLLELKNKGARFVVHVPRISLD